MEIGNVAGLAGLWDMRAQPLAAPQTTAVAAPQNGGDLADAGVPAAAEAAAQGATDQTGADTLARERAEAKVMNDRFAQACQTCKNRKYQDGSNDPGVSFKTPQNIDPGIAASVVMGHEQEHVAHEQARAKQEGGEVVSQTVVLHGDICPECGRYYIAGGTTTTVTRHGGRQNANETANGAGQGGLDITA